MRVAIRAINPKEFRPVFPDTTTGIQRFSMRLSGGLPSKPVYERVSSPEDCAVFVPFAGEGRPGPGERKDRCDIPGWDWIVSGRDNTSDLGSSPVRRLGYS